MHDLGALSHCRVTVIWIDWYPYHVARFRGLDSVPVLKGRVAGIELVGGIGVHAGLKFREDLPEDLAIETLLPGASWKDANKFQLSRKLWRGLNELDPEVVLVPGYYTLPAIAAAVWARLHGAASVLMTESTATDHTRVGWKELLKSFGLRMLFGWAVTGGEAHVQYLHQLGFPADRITGFYDVVDNDALRQGADSLRLRGARPAELPKEYFLYVGRLSEEKNVAGLLQSWNEYRNAGGTWSLVLVGDGPEMKTLKALATASAYSADVLFTGLKTSRELIPFYAFAGCFVLPSTREPWGLVVNEAMAAGLPVLVSRACGCALDLVSSGKNGFIFDPADQSSLTEVLHRVESLRREERDRMGSVSAEIIRGFSPLKFGHSIAAIAHANHDGSAMQTISGGVA